MKELLSLFWKQDEKYIQLVSANRRETDAFNERILSVLTFIGGLLLLIPVLSVPFSSTKKSIIYIYLLSTTFFFLIFYIFKVPIMKKFTLYGLYITFSIFFLFAIYLSIIHSPDMRATILLGAFCIMPLGFIDRPRSMNSFMAFWLVLHTVLAYVFKPQYALDDTINSLCFAILGCLIGNMMVNVRLENYEAYRLLTIEKETDVLTGLFNRRKLFEALALLENSKTEKPTGILMIDIDNFKTFNDSYGHAEGDRCLGHFGKVLKNFKENLRFNFYRYGGEEFVAMAYGYGENELFSLTENLRIAVQDANMDQHQITVSIGVVYCGSEQISNYETVIDRADVAAYMAKDAGRNQICAMKF